MSAQGAQGEGVIDAASRANRRRPGHQHPAPGVEQAFGDDEIVGGVGKDVKAFRIQRLRRFDKTEDIGLKRVLLADHFKLDPVRGEDFARHLRGGDGFLRRATTGGVGQHIHAEIADQRVLLEKVDLHDLVAVLHQPAQVPQPPTGMTHGLLGGGFELVDRMSAGQVEQSLQDPHRLVSSYLVHAVGPRATVAADQTTTLQEVLDAHAEAGNGLFKGTRLAPVKTADVIGLTFDQIIGLNKASRPDWTYVHDAEDMFHELFVLFGYLAALTTKIELTTGVLVLPMRGTALVAKQAAEVDVLSGGCGSASASG